MTSAPQAATPIGARPDIVGVPLASVVITTYNRCDALERTLLALAAQDVAASSYEVMVIDDGSTDRTADMLNRVRPPYALRVQRLSTNRGVSAGRNAGMRTARGRYLILLSDDLLVGENFVSAHARTLERFPDAWVVGGFRQLEDLTTRPFGRFLDGLERRFQRARTGPQIAPGIFQMHAPTARNMSLPRSDIGRIGLFDERFRVTCEDQDLAHRASELGVRFLYNADIDCVHNDQAADLNRYARFQERGTIDTVRLCRKYPSLHCGAAVGAVNGPVRGGDGPKLVTKKLLKSLLSRPRAMLTLERLIGVAERAGAPDRILFALYRGRIGLSTFRGWRAGLREAATG